MTCHRRDLSATDGFIPLSSSRSWDWRTPALDALRANGGTFVLFLAGWAWSRLPGSRSQGVPYSLDPGRNAGVYRTLI
jgi:hypothetical protein